MALERQQEEQLCPEAVQRVSDLPGSGRITRMPLDWMAAVVDASLSLNRVPRLCMNTKKRSGLSQPFTSRIRLLPRADRRLIDNDID